MKIDAQLTCNLAEIPAVARAAEAIGFDAVWTEEAQHEAILPLPLIAEHSSRLQFGTGIAVAFARSPMTLAQASWDLAARSDGRFILGLGTQVRAHIERRFGMTWAAPVPRLREMILAIRAIWDCWQNGTPPAFSGQFYRFTLMPPFFSPGPIAHPNVPIFIAGVNAPLCRLAGEVGDGFHAHPFHSIKYLREVTLPAIEAGAAKSGRSRAGLEMTSAVFVVTDDAQRERTRTQLSFYASTPSYHAVMDCHGWGETREKLGFLASRGQWDEMPREITDEMLDAFALVCSPAELPEKLLAKYEGLLDRIMLYDHFVPGQMDDLHRAMVAAARAHRGSSG